MLVYRDSARERSGVELERELTRALARSDAEAGSDPALEALLRAGEIESALADLEGTASPNAEAAAQLTDALAARLLAPRGERPPAPVAALRLPERLRLTTPKGYAYDALDPREYAAMAERLPLPSANSGLIGIRSIGTSLSAVVRAALARRQHLAERISVRPSGHTSNRTLTFDAREQAWIRRLLARDSAFLIVDEGPGMSGSTFLAVARALEREGVASSRITLLCSHRPNVERLTGTGAPQQWPRYRSCAPPPREAGAASIDLSAGAWRKHVFGADERAWPAIWSQLERRKLLSADGRWLDKFEGYAPYSQDALQRANTLATAGFAPAPTPQRAGYVRYPWLAGRPATREDLSRGACEHLATYCAFRAHAFRVGASDDRALARMLQTNVLEASGVELGDRMPLESRSPIVPDARMQPYKWLVTESGRFYKVDGHADGDAHLLPGPADVAWDLAGAIVEWRMNAAHQAAFIQTFERMTGDRVSERLPSYLLAYTAYRVGVLCLSLGAAPLEEASRMQAARTRYSRKLDRLLRLYRLSPD